MVFVYKYPLPLSQFFDNLRLPADLKDDKAIITFIEDTAEETIAQGRGFFVLLRKDENQLVAFAGHHGTARIQPKDVAGLREYACSLLAVQPFPDWLWKTLDMLEKIEDSALVSLVKVPPTTYIRYHRATNLPCNFVALGDSVMTGVYPRPRRAALPMLIARSEPLLGEGCTKALRCALVLYIVLLDAQAASGRTLPASFAPDFFAEEYEKPDWLWENTRILADPGASTDYGAPSTECKGNNCTGRPRRIGDVREILWQRSRGGRCWADDGMSASRFFTALRGYRIHSHLYRI
ncbi:hypothetical protein GGX14DRAFT_625685 [Mycena pura]|uniref:Uncharacterized protein n=1 Tax=Mycena pura TaxID=153505 RepID=A0AAD6YHL6_9AGAR|nr:hypothetical protein GGX14DRAFT_625685 [Mycena pura]